MAATTGNEASARDVERDDINHNKAIPFVTM